MMSNFWPATRCRGRGAVGLGAVLLLLAAPAARAQQVLVQANVANDTLKNTFGPNRLLFGHFYVGYGLVAGAGGPGAPGRYGLGSADLRAGGRLKLRVSQALAANLDLGYSYLQYELAQNGLKTVPTPALHRRETLGLHQLFAETSLRLNYGRRGNSVGRYLDLLAGGSWAAGTSHTTDDDPAPGIGSRQTTEHGLPYLRRWAGSVGVRLGIDRYALVARRRLSPAFTPDAGFPAGAELPRWLMGVEIGLF